MIGWILEQIERSTTAKEDAWNRYIEADDDSAEESGADSDYSYFMGKIDAYKEVLKYIEDAQRASVGE